MLCDPQNLHNDSISIEDDGTSIDGFDLDVLRQAWWRKEVKIGTSLTMENRQKAVDLLLTLLIIGNYNFSELNL